MVLHPPAQRLLIQDVHFTIGNLPLFQGLNAEIGPGVTLVHGGDGRGKSSLLRLLAGTLTPDRGRMQLNGMNLTANPGQTLHQVFWTEPQSTAHDAVSGLDYLVEMRGRFPHFDTDVADTLIDAFGLEDHIEKPLFMLSTGSKRKVWLCAAFASQAPLTLVDMPFSALDKTSIGRVTQQLVDEALRASTTQRIWVMTDYAAPDGLALAGRIDLGD